jgi:lipoprotein-releasing system permease protein
MYKLLLCWRYLRTRYLALVCIVSVMLGVATLIVVNSVMGGFSSKLKERVHNLLSDVVVETPDLSGFPDPQGKMALIRNDPICGPKIDCMSGTLEGYAMMQFPNNPMYSRPVRLIGIDPEERSKLGGFKEFLENPRNRDQPGLAFELDEEGRQRFNENQQNDWIWEIERNRGPDADPRVQLPPPGNDEIPPLPPGLPIPIPEPGPVKPAPALPSRPVHVTYGVVLGHAIAYYRIPATATKKAEERCEIHCGDELIFTTVSGAKMRPVADRFVVTDYCKTGMSEYDSSYVYVPIQHLQRLRSMENHVTSIQIKLKDYNDAKDVVERLRVLFEPMGLRVNSWEEKQGAILAAISIEQGILNVLLFLIIAVAGFGILAIFSMIVVEKTRDIGILKALGASNGGIMKIFLGYGLLLGMVGAGCGTALGLAIAHNINGIESLLAKITGTEIFDRSIYYFDSIPVDIQSSSITAVNIGAIAIAVLFSILPALRAAVLHPVRALRFE